MTNFGKLQVDLPKGGAAESYVPQTIVIHFQRS